MRARFFIRCLQFCQQFFQRVTHLHGFRSQLRGFQAGEKQPIPVVEVDIIVTQPNFNHPQQTR